MQAVVTPYLAKLGEEVSRARFDLFSTEQAEEFYVRYTVASIASLYTQSVATGRAKSIRLMKVLNLIAFSIQRY